MANGVKEDVWRGRVKGKPANPGSLGGWPLNRRARIYHGDVVAERSRGRGFDSRSVPGFITTSDKLYVTKQCNLAPV